MGFIDFMSKMFKGEPIFSNPNETHHHSDDKPVFDPHQSRSFTQAPAAPTRIDSQGNKYLPEVAIGRSEAHVNGTVLEVWANIRNNSPFVMFVDKIKMCGQSHDFDCKMRPGEMRQWRIYRGPKLVHDTYHTADLYYQDAETGDYFCSSHAIEYKYENDRTYTPEDFRLLRPIKDL